MNSQGKGVQIEKTGIHWSSGTFLCLEMQKIWNINKNKQKDTFQQVDNNPQVVR